MLMKHIGVTLSLHHSDYVTNVFYVGTSYLRFKAVYFGPGEEILYALRRRWGKDEWKLKKADLFLPSTRDPIIH